MFCGIYDVGDPWLAVAIYATYVYIYIIYGLLVNGSCYIINQRGINNYSITYLSSMALLLKF